MTIRVAAPTGLLEVTGQPIKFAGFERWVFVKHRAIEGDRLNGLKWGITELSTGVSLAKGATLTAAVDLAKRKLASVGPQGFGKKLAWGRRLLKKSGHSYPVNPYPASPPSSVTA